MPLHAADRDLLVRRARAQYAPTSSLDAPIRYLDGEAITLGDAIADLDAASAEADLERASDVAALRRALRHLDARSRTVLELRHGLRSGDPDDGLTLAQIGDRLGVSRERIRQIEAAAHATLRDRLELDAA